MQAPNVQDVIARLTFQEKRILEFVTDGLTNQNIAETLFIAECTVKKHREHIYEKAEVKGVVAIRQFIKDADAHLKNTP